MKHCVYITIGETGKFYVGKTTAAQISKGYQGSGKVIKDYLKTHKAFTFVVSWFETSEEAFKAEAQWVNEDLLKNPQCLNLVIGGCGGNKIEWNEDRKESLKKRLSINHPRKGVKHTEETKAKIALKNKGRGTSEFAKERALAWRKDPANFDARSMLSKKAWETRKERATEETRAKHAEAARKGHETRKQRKAQKEGTLCQRG